MRDRYPVIGEGLPGAVLRNMTADRDAKLRHHAGHINVMS